MKTSEAIAMIENDFNLKFIDDGNDLYTLEAHQNEVAMKDWSGNICDYGITTSQEWKIATRKDLAQLRLEYLEYMFEQVDHEEAIKIEAEICELREIVTGDF